ncbi:hypothetical protein AAHC03_04908 [Spirometra sp. Aus1]
MNRNNFPAGEILSVAPNELTTVYKDHFVNSTDGRRVFPSSDTKEKTNRSIPISIIQASTANLKAPQNAPSSYYSQISHTMQGRSLSDTEELRAEVQRLAEKVCEQSKFIDQLRSSLPLLFTSDGEMKQRDVLTDLCQQKLNISCLERNHSALETWIRRCQRDIMNLTNVVNQQQDEIFHLHEILEDIQKSIPHALSSFCSEASYHPSTAGPELTRATFGPASYRSASCNELPHQSSPCNRYPRNRPSALNAEPSLRGSITAVATGGGDGDLGRPPHPQIMRAALSGGVSGSPNSFSRRRICSASSFRRNLTKARNMEAASGSSSKMGGWDFLLKSPRLALRRPLARLNSAKEPSDTNSCPDNDQESTISTSSTQRPISGGAFKSTLSLLLPTATNFEEWPLASVCDFLGQLGLGYCAAAARTWVRTGADIIAANTKKLEQDLGISKPLHLKKLLIHVSLRTTNQLRASRETSYLPKIDPHPDFSVTAWLEDLGLLVYREVFEYELIDAYVLNELTLADLQNIGITNELHMLSLRRGLQLLRHINFDLSQLSRRPTFRTPEPLNRLSSASPPDFSEGSAGEDAEEEDVFKPPAGELETKQPGAEKDFEAGVDDFVAMPAIMSHSGISVHSSRSLPSNCNSLPPKTEGCARRATSPILSVLPSRSPLIRCLGELSSAKESQDNHQCVVTPNELALWTFHRLEVWLRDIELPEYVSNLRASGLHGALFVFENRFTAETLADVLDIAANKTLLRRHLTDQFANLVGEQLMLRKQNCLSKPEAVPLTTFGKFKTTVRRTIFPSPRRRTAYYLNSEPLCPAELDFDFMTSFCEFPFSSTSTKENCWGCYVFLLNS